MIGKKYISPPSFDQNLLSALMGDDLSLEHHLKTLCDEIAEVDRRFEPRQNITEVSGGFFETLIQNRFWPAVLILTDGDKKDPILSSNTALELSDNFEDIFQTLKRASNLLQNGIQVALDFSTLRAARSLIQDSHLQSVGPVKFMKLFENTPQNLNQITPLRFLLNIDHLDIESYLDYILAAPSFIRFAIGLNSDFLEALKHNQDMALRHKPDGEISYSISAQSLFKKIAKVILKGIPLDFIFCDQIKKFKKEKQLEDNLILNSQNQLVLPNELTMTGVINLQSLTKDGGLDLETLQQTLFEAVHFLDNCFESHFYCDEQTKIVSKNNRRIALSVLGLESYLRGLNHDDNINKDQRNLSRLLDILYTGLIAASQNLGEKRGMKNKVFYKGKWHPVRNTQLLAQIHMPLLSQIANTPSYFFKREMTAKDFMGMYPYHLQWQDGLNNLASFKHPIKAINIETFAKLLFHLHEAKALSFELA